MTRAAIHVQAEIPAGMVFFGCGRPLMVVKAPWIWPWSRSSRWPTPRHASRPASGEHRGRGMDMDDITITVPGEPRGKGRAKSFRRGSFIGHYTPAETVSYENLIKFAAQQAMNGTAPIDVPVVVDITAVFSVPGSWSQKKRAKAISGEIRPGKKPDWDNTGKIFSDAINGIVFRDDALVVDGRVRKVYGPTSMLIGTVRPA